MLKIGIVGLPNVGKSTLFNALTQKKVDVSNYPFCTIEPNVGIVAVPDERLDRLATLSRSKKVVAAAVEFVDIAGLVKGAAEGEGLGNQFLTHIRETDAIAEVVRVFENPDIMHVAGASHPAADIEVLEYELMLKDADTVAKRLSSLERDVRAGKKGAAEESVALHAIAATLNADQTLLKSDFNNHDGTLIEVRLQYEKLQLLTAKPIIYVFNASEDQLASEWQPDETLREKIGSAGFVVVSAKIESELGELPSEERKEFLDALAMKASGLERLIRAGYETLGLMTFFTTGEDETRGWTVPIGSSAPRAGRAIHSDFEEKFIRAEVIHYEKLLEAGSYGRARELGWLRTEGKECIIQDGDVIEFKI